MIQKEAARIFDAFRLAYGRTLFAVDREKKTLLKKKKDDLEALEKERTYELASIQRYVSQKCENLLHELKLNGIATNKPSDKGILKVADFLNFGDAYFPQISEEAKVPYIFPFLGHNNLVLSDSGEEVYSVLQSLIIHVLEQTAAGQIEVFVYNPDMRGEFSCFSGLEQYNLISTLEDLEKELANLSKEVVTTDKMMKGKYSSLIEFRQISQQAVGSLRLFIIACQDWIENDNVKKQMLRISESAIRAGCAFVFAIDKNQLAGVPTLLKRAVLLQKNPSVQSWSSKELPQLDLRFTNYSSDYIETFLKDYAKLAEEATVVTVPFDSIEEIRNCWAESTAGGIQINLGKVGLDTVGFKLGDEMTQMHNVLISGATGKGKSNLLGVMIHSMCCRYSPDELELFLLDYKDGLTFKPYAYSSQLSWLPHAKVLGIESARDFAVATLEYVEAERQRRALIMKDVADSIELFRKKRPEMRMPRIVVIIDEYQKLVEVKDGVGEQIASLMENLVRQGRSFGIHMVLASQVVEHSGAMLGRGESIYSAFPVRISLKNTLQESYSIFGQGNDAAAKLRVRGEAVINLDYGAISSNLKFSVAYADPQMMIELRKNWCKQNSSCNKIPLVFSKNDNFKLVDAVSSIKNWRENVLNANADPMLLCGQLISVTRQIVGVRMSKDAGRNVAILGAGDGEKPDIKSQPFNFAVGLIENMAISLALQHPCGNARFFLINSLDAKTSSYNGINNWMRIMERFGYPVEVVQIEEAPAFFVNISEELKDKDPEEAYYIFAIGMDRCYGMSEKIGTDMFNSISGTSEFQKILKDGSPKGVHIIAWWTNVATYREHIGYNGDGYIGTKLLLRLDESTSKSVISPFLTWNGPVHRALLYDNTELEGNLTLIPMSPCSMRDAGEIEAVVWE